ncbi:deoxyribose-phosphate aldolase [candidate division KSB1 bacterium]|nr:MAG: deoxyribose-phosphate aldolase [candidate division KSB1 bacterium]
MITFEFDNPAKYIDHTLLKPDATEKEIKRFCRDAAEFDFAAVCVNPSRVEYVSGILRESNIAICSVAGFPLGSCTTETKVFESIQAIGHGAKEIDAVINIGKLKDKEFSFVEFEIKKLAEACHEKEAKLKVIVETCFLSSYEKQKVCELVAVAGGDFVKTSTGFGSAGADEEDIKLMRSVLVGTSVKIKASGGISTLEQCYKMLEAGAERIGTSHGIEIVSEFIKVQNAGGE